MYTRRNFRLFAAGLSLAFTGFVVFLAVKASDGRLIYTLDDPYIHLAVAETILQGGYGVNAAEYASPSSSILYPFLLAGGIWLGLGEAAPLILGMVANAVTLWLLAGLIWDTGAGATALRAKLHFLFLPLPLILALNMPGLPLTGMEHPLHIMASVMVLTGLIGLASGGAGAVVAILGILLCAVIRFEGLALALAGIVALFWLRHRGAGIVALVLVLAALGAYGTLMQGFGLPLLPSSVLAKSEAAAAASDSGMLAILQSMLVNAYLALGNRWGVLFALFAIFALAALVGRSDPGRAWEKPVLAAAGFALAAHVGLGQYGWFSRYEVYGIAILITAAIFWFRRPVAGFGDTGSLVALAGGLLILAAPYLQTIALTPQASRNIYQQQYQMHRFATGFFAHPVAVNDLGWVAYKNDAYVLDLWGLGSEEARRLRRREGRTVAMLRQLTEGRGVAYAMLYDAWFPEAIPAEWCRIAELRTSKISAASGEVAFYLIDRSREAEMRAALARFAPTLPGGARLVTEPCYAN